MISPYHKIKKNAGVIRDLAGIVRKAGINPYRFNLLSRMRAAALSILSAGTGWLKGDGSACGFRDPIALSPNRSPIELDMWTGDDTLIVAGLTLTSINFTIDMNGGVDNVILLSNSGSSFLLAASAGSSNSNITNGFGTCTYTIDGVSFSGTRGELYALLAVSGTHDVTISTSVSENLYLGGFSGWPINVHQITNLVVNGVSYRQPTATAFAQATLSKQPLAFPCSPGAEYASFPGVDGNYLGIGGSAEIDFSADFVLTVVMLPIAETQQTLLGSSGDGFKRIFFTSNGRIDLRAGGNTEGESAVFFDSAYIPATEQTLVFSWDASESELTLTNNGVLVSTEGLSNPSNVPIEQIGSGLNNPFAGYIKSVALTGASAFGIDISRDAPHMATSFTATSGQTVTVNQSGQDPAMIVRHPGIVSDDASHLLSTLTEGQNGGWVIAVFTVLGDGGDQAGRVVSCNQTGSADRSTTTGWIAVFNSLGGLNSQHNGSTATSHTGAFVGSIIYEAFAGDTYFSRVNGGTAKTATVDISAMDWNEINIFAKADSSNNATLFLQEVLILPKTFSADTVAAAMPLLAAELGHTYE